MSGSFIRHDGVANLLLWGPRVLGLLAASYLGIFALDVFTGEKPFVQAILDFLIHAAPSILLFGVVIVSWRRQWIAGAFFTAMALYYAFTTLERLDWILSISGPLLVTGILYFLSWWKRDMIQRSTGK